MSFGINNEGNIIALSINKNNYERNVKIYRKNTDTSQWTQLGNTLIGDSDKALTKVSDTYPYGYFGKQICLNNNGTIIGILGYNYIEVYEYILSTSQGEDLVRKFAGRFFYCMVLNFLKCSHAWGDHVSTAYGMVMKKI